MYPAVDPYPKVGHRCARWDASQLQFMHKRFPAMWRRRALAPVAEQDHPSDPQLPSRGNHLPGNTSTEKCCDCSSCTSASRRCGAEGALVAVAEPHPQPDARPG